MFRIQPSDRRLREVFRQAVRDMRAISNDWRGLRNPVMDRSPRTSSVAARAPAAQVLGAREVVLSELSKETDDAVTLILKDPSGAPFDFLPGAFFTLVVTMPDGTVERRAYSASSFHRAPDRLALTCKRVEGGRVSTYLNRGLQVGARLGLLGPAGAFTITPDPSRSRRLVLIGGGSGITPLMAMIEALLAVEPGTELLLIYGNRDPESIIFRRALGDLVAANPGRLRVSYLVEEYKPGCILKPGRLDRNGISSELDAVPWPLSDVDGWYVCGPEAVREGARELLLERGVSEDRLHEECFSAAPRRAATSAARGVTSSLTIRRKGQPDGESTAMLVPAGATILEAVSATGESLPFSCAVGGCGACRVRLLEGEVVMDEPNCLSAEERAQGYILTCCGAPMGPCTIEVP